MCRLSSKRKEVLPGINIKSVLFVATLISFILATPQGIGFNELSTMLSPVFSRGNVETISHYKFFVGFIRLNGKSGNMLYCLAFCWIYSAFSICSRSWNYHRRNSNSNSNGLVWEVLVIKILNESHVPKFNDERLAKTNKNSQKSGMWNDFFVDNRTPCILSQNTVPHSAFWSLPRPFVTPKKLPCGSVLPPIARTNKYRVCMGVKNHRLVLRFLDGMSKCRRERCTSRCLAWIANEE